MTNKCRLNECSFNIILRSFNINNTLSRNTNQTSILNNNNTLHKRGEGILEVEDNNQEEDLVEEEAKLYVIIVGIQDTFPKIVKFMEKIVHIVKHLITVTNSVRSLLRNGMLELSLTPT